MAAAIPATDYLSKPQEHEPRPVCAVFGDDAFLKREVLRMLRKAALGGGDAEFSLSTFDGKDTELRDVMTDVNTVAMFGGDRRMVIVDGADDFVSRYRESLEQYVGQPNETAVLALELKSLPSNTRLYKAMAKQGLLIDGSTPKGGQLPRWLSGWARSRHQAKLSAATAELMVELIGPELGLIDQEIERLALLGGEKREITNELILQHVGGWRTRTTWDMLDAALEGRLDEALEHLDRLLGSGEQPIGLLGQIGWSLRQMGAATRVVLNEEHHGRRIALHAALEQLGLKPFPRKKLEKQLRRLGRHRGQLLYGWLLEADLDLKGASPLPPRTVLERLIVRLASPSEAVLGGAGLGGTK